MLAAGKTDAHVTDIRKECDNAASLYKLFSTTDVELQIRLSVLKLGRQMKFYQRFVKHNS